MANQQEYAKMADKSMRRGTSYMVMGAGFCALAYYMYTHSEKPLPDPAAEALSRAAHVGGGALQQNVEVNRSLAGGPSHSHEAKDLQEKGAQRKGG